MCLALVCMTMACSDPERDEIHHVANSFAHRYYNLDVKGSKEFCHPDILTIMDFRAKNVRDIDRELHREIDSARVRVVSYTIDRDKNSANVYIEVKNFIRVDYVEEYIHVVPCDTFMIILVNEFKKGWKVRHPN